MARVHRWLINVRDVNNRPDRDLVIAVDGTDLLITAPAPGTARLTGEQIGHLIDALREARLEVFGAE